MTLLRLFSLAFVAFQSMIHAQQIEIYTESLPPFQIVKASEVSGQATSKVKQLLDSLDLRYNIQVVPWARAYNIVKSTPNTLIYSMNRSPEREDAFHWITVVAEIGNSFISLRSNPFEISQLEDAKNYVVAVVRDGYAYDFLLENGFIVDKNMYVVATLEQQMSLLINKKVDFLFTDIQSVKHKLELQQLDPEMVVQKYTQPAWTRDLYLAANIDTNPQLLQQLSAAYVHK